MKISCIHYPSKNTFLIICFWQFKTILLILKQKKINANLLQNYINDSINFNTINSQFPYANFKKALAKNGILLIDSEAHYA